MEDKIKKLLKLSELGSTVHERDAAFARATSLAASCGIDLDDLEEEIGGPVPEDFGDLEEVTLDRFKRAPGWRTALFFACSKITGCFALRFGGCWVADPEGSYTETQFRLYGRDKALATCAQLYHALADAIVELSLQFDGRSKRNAYRLGAAYGVKAAHYASVEKLPGSSKALVLARSAEERYAEAEDWYKDRGGKVGSSWGGGSRGYGTESAFAAGYEAGQSLDRVAPQRARLGSG